MFDKRLLRAVPKTKTFVMKQVMSQWIALLMNIVFTIMICFLFIILHFDLLLVFRKTLLIQL